MEHHRLLMASASGTGPIDMTYQYPFRKRLSSLHLVLKCGDAGNSGPCQQTDSYFGIPQVAVKNRRLRPAARHKCVGLPPRVKPTAQRRDTSP